MSSLVVSCLLFHSILLFNHQCDFLRFCFILLLLFCKVNNYTLKLILHLSFSFYYSFAAKIDIGYLFFCQLLPVNGPPHTFSLHQLLFFKFLWSTSRRNVISFCNMFTELVMKQLYRLCCIRKVVLVCGAAKFHLLSTSAPVGIAISSQSKGAANETTPTDNLRIEFFLLRNMFT